MSLDDVQCVVTLCDQVFDTSTVAEEWNCPSDT